MTAQDDGSVTGWIGDLRVGGDSAATLTTDGPGLSGCGRASGPGALQFQRLSSRMVAGASRTRISVAYAGADELGDHDLAGGERGCDDKAVCFVQPVWAVRVAAQTNARSPCLH